MPSSVLSVIGRGLWRRSTYHRRADEARAADDEDSHGIDPRSEAIPAASRRLMAVS